MAITTKGFVSKKHSLINKANKWMLISVVVASMIVGVSAVSINYLIRMINFQAKVIGEKQTTIATLKESLTNYDELRKSVAGLNRDEGLKAVACIKDYGLSDGASCSALDGEYLKDPLRIVSNSLPPYENLAALGSSLDDLLLKRGDGLASVEGISLGSASNTSGSQTKTTATRMNFSFQAIGELGCSNSVTKCSEPLGLSKLVNNIERSIRFIDVNSAYLTFRSTNRVELGIQASAFRTSTKNYSLGEKTLYASDKARKVSNK
ncbi:MAG: hypothetical protein LBE03_02190 [Candidatus Nomurabacteria bacterium]|jgi:cell division protein FtsL|nr:hypothetical protein [Candidatus Nomurabacteria bacterium]